MPGITVKASERDVCGYAGVYLLDIPYSADRMYDYYIPPDLRDFAKPGAFAVVPFGGGNRRRTAVIAEVRSETDAKKTKPLISVSNESAPLNAEQLGLCRYLAAMTLCTVGDAVRAIVPAGSARSRRLYVPTGKQIGENSSLSAGAVMVYDYIRNRGGARDDLIVSNFGASAKEHISALMIEGLIEGDAEISDSGIKYEKVYSLALNEAETEQVLGGGRTDKMKRRLTLPSQLAVVERLMRGEATEAELLSDIEGLSQSQLTTLYNNGLINIDKRESYRDPTADAEPNLTPLTPNRCQAEALKTLGELASDGKPHGALLYGVTGSGKTTVILGMIDKMIESGRGVIVLLPEISLTPQMLGVFCSRYGRRVAVMHSGLSAGERFDAYTRVRNGLADIVIGTRSAVFAPVKNLGMLVIDEEQEHTYKSDMTPKYHARDIARKRCADNRALMLLSSATPSVESFKKAKEGIYTLVRLDERYGSAGLPDVTIADMREEAHGGNVSPLGNELAKALIETDSRGEQSILFLNRRGYNTFMSCVDCGEAIKCPSCSVAMTYHTKKGSYDEGELVCHWCGRRAHVPEKCPSCGGTHLSRCGFGTQRVEQELSTLLPDSNIMRMDADTTSHKLAYDKLLREFRTSGNVLLGTQMVTKGHDFPRVTLVGVLLADMSLYLDDFRSNERTFALLTQVIGRAGRAERPGRAIIQTNNPENDIIKLACEQDYDSFYENEIKLRKLLTFPPFCDIVLMTVSHSDERELMMATEQLKKMYDKALAETYTDVPQVTFGPFEAPVYKVDDRFRMRIIIKCRLNNRSRELFAFILRSFGANFSGTRKPQLAIDFNPSNI